MQIEQQPPTEAIRSHALSARIFHRARNVLFCCAFGVAALFSGRAPAQSTNGPARFVLVFKSHFDIGYSGLAKDVVHDYRTIMIDRALETIERYRTEGKGQRFVWTVPGWPMYQILWDKQSPARKAAVEAAFKDGYLVTHALAFTTETAALDLEDLVRGFWFSSELSRRYGLPLPHDAKMTDVPCHTWVVPTLLKHAGVTFFHVGMNDANQRLRVPPLFWWEGPDGSRVLTMMSYGYGSSVLPPKDWPYKTWLSLVHAGDNEGPPPPDQVQNVIHSIKEKFPNTEITIGQLSDFGDAILAEHPDLPVIRGDFSDPWIHGFMGSPPAVSDLRRNRPAVLAAEALYTEGTAWGVDLYDIKEDLHFIYEKSLLHSEHTWGLANQHYVTPLFGEEWTQKQVTGLDGAHQYLERGADEHSQYATDAKLCTDAILDDGLNTMAYRVNQAGPRFLVFNPLPWKRSGVVEFTVPVGGFSRPGGAVVAVDDPQGELLPIVGYGRETKRVLKFAVKDIPPFGYRTYVSVNETAKAPSQLRSDAAANTIESPFFKVTFDPARGAIRSIIDKTSGRELVDQSSAYGFGQYLHEKFGRKELDQYVKDFVHPPYYGSHGFLHTKNNLPISVEHSAWSAANLKLVLDQTPMSITGTLVPAPDQRSEDAPSLSVTLYQDQSFIDLEMHVFNKPAIQQPEASWICLPFATDDKPSFRIGLTGSIVDPEKDIYKTSNHSMIWSDTGIAVLDGQGAGAGLCPIYSPLVSLCRPGCSEFWPEFKATNGAVFINLHNNHWNTNFRPWWSGNLASQVRIWSISRFDAQKDLITPAWEARAPFRVGFATHRAGTQPVRRSGLALSMAGVLVTAFGPNPDGPGTVLRLWEQAGHSGACTVTLPEGFDAATAQPADLRGRFLGEPIPVRSGRFEAALKGFAPASFILPPTSKRAGQP